MQFLILTHRFLEKYLKQSLFTHLTLSVFWEYLDYDKDQHLNLTLLTINLKFNHFYSRHHICPLTDQAFGLTSTSRLGCQFCVGKQHEGILVKLPLATRNFYVVSFVPTSLFSSCVIVRVVCYIFQIRLN